MGSPKKMGTDTSAAFVAEGYFGGVGRSEVREEKCLHLFSCTVDATGRLDYNVAGDSLFQSGWWNLLHRRWG
jgi:hypothetical protein